MSALTIALSASGEEAEGAEEAEAPDLSFLEFLGSMVESGEEGVWLDPLDLDDDLLIEEVEAPDPEQPVAKGESS